MESDSKLYYFVAIGCYEHSLNPRPIINNYCVQGSIIKCLYNINNKDYYNYHIVSCIEISEDEYNQWSRIYLLP